MIIGTGIDILEVDRMARTLNRTPRFAESVFTTEESVYCEAAANVKIRAQRYAARFAAKEAFLKALGTGLSQGIHWQDIHVTRDPQGRPGLMLHGEAQTLSRQAGVTQMHLSLTHSREYAAAVVILETWTDRGQT